MRQASVAAKRHHGVMAHGSNNSMARMAA